MIQKMGQHFFKGWERENFKVNIRKSTPIRFQTVMPRLQIQKDLNPLNETAEGYFPTRSKFVIELEKQKLFAPRL